MRRLALFFVLIFLLLGCASTPAEPPPTLPATAVPTPTLSPSPTANQSAPAAELIWQRPFGMGLKGPAAFAAGTVFVATDTAVYALDPTSGDTVWELVLDGGIWSRSLAANDTAVIVGSPGKMVALNPADGAILWQLPLVGDLLWAPLVTDGLVVAGTAFVGPGVTPNPDGKAWVYAVELASGELMWSWETAVYTLTTPTSNGSQLVVGGSFLNPESDVEEGGFLRLHAFDQTTGELQWQTERQDGFIKSLAANEDTVFLLAYTDMVYGLDGRSGEVRWQYPTENWSPGFSWQDGVLYFGSDNAFVHAVDGGLGTAVWRTQLEGVFNAPRAELTLDERTAYFQGNDNQLYALDLASGELVWHTTPQPRSRVPLTFGNGRLFLVDQKGTLSAFQTP
ncbi:MAG: PQQ-binding-like beta-propeller repeat protein [Anaerolineales bacterium]|nr:PQQ-binding-like beta-propeller repeat protein [Anaerolineales bacterium]MCB8940198.1 PQQ-binding-like beta-propeller repeat protein [Ardenticatenaceae bacterium]